MTEVAFHFNVPERLPYVCRLLRKAVNAGSRVLVKADGPVLQELDRSLWTFAPLEFIAHCLANAAPEMLQASPVVLADSAEHPRLQALPRQVLLNLSATVPPGFDRFERLIEVVSYDEADRLAARRRWKHYTEAGYSMTRHDIAAPN